MGGVDLGDQLRGCYTVARKSKKWWRYLLWFCVDISVVNAYILRSLSPNHAAKTQLEFRVELAKNLIGKFSTRKHTLTSSCLEGGHWPVTMSKGLCKRCLRRKEKSWCRMGCEQCNSVWNASRTMLVIFLDWSIKMMARNLNLNLSKLFHIF